MKITTFYNSLLLVFALLSFIGGVRVLRTNPRSLAHRLYFVLMMTVVSIFGMIFVYLRFYDTPTSWFAMRLLLTSGILVHTLLLHIVLIGVHYFQNKKRIHSALMYSPVLIWLFFSIGNLIIPRSSNWGDSMLYLNFYFSYFGSLGISLICVIRNSIKYSDHPHHLQSTMLSISIVLGLLFAGSFLVLQSRLLFPAPHVTSFGLLFVLIAIGDILLKDSVQQLPIPQKKRLYVQIILTSLCYLFFSFLQTRNTLLSDLAVLVSLEVSTVRGVLTQLQLIASVYLVIYGQKAGFFASIGLTVMNLASSLLYIARTDSTIPVPGLVASLGILVLLVIIREYQKDALGHIQRIEEQRVQLEQSDKKLHTLAYYDTLTGLASRQFFIQQVRASIARAKSDGKKFAILFIDLDSFKSINDTAGHATGDAVLKKLPSLLQPLLKEDDMLSRFGGDEFLLLLSDIGQSDRAIDVAQAVLEALKKPIAIKAHEYFISASIGLALYPYDGDTVHKLIRNADIAMYAAKREGKNQFVCCSHELQMRVSSSMELSNSLHRALERGQLSVQYQLLVQTDSQEIVSMEALIRWQHETQGLIDPNVFIPMAEKTGLIRPIGLWVAEQALIQRNHIQNISGKKLSVSINVSVKQLKDNHFVQGIKHLLQKTQTQAQLLQIEITESTASLDNDEILEQLKLIKELGVSLAIDDFGTGHSSFSRLASFPIDILKIDRAFVQNIDSESKKEKAIIKSIIQLAKNLDKTVCAEGVETEDQYQYLKENGCDLIQGFYFYKPMEMDQIEKIFQQSSLEDKTSLT